MMIVDSTYRKALELFTKIYPVNESLMEEIWEHGQLVNFRKEDNLIDDQRTADNIFFILEGFCSCSFFKDGRENIIKFIDTGEFCLDYYSFLRRKKSVFVYKATEPVKALAISRKEYENLIRKNPEFLMFLYKYITEDKIKSDMHFYHLRNNNAKGRIRLYMENEYMKLLMKHVTHKNIASFLDMTPETFSTHYSEINKNKKR